MITKEQMIDYLQCDISSFRFQDLNDFVISKGNCVVCGACLSICPRIGVIQNKPSLVDYDPECSLCYRYCSKTYFPKKLFEKEIFNETTQKDSLLGCYQNISIARSTDNKILKKAQNGGVITTLLVHALNTDLVDGVIIATKDENWYPKPLIATTPEELIYGAGSIYSMIPILSIYKDAVCKYKIKKLGIVGLPCQMQAIRKFQLWPPFSNKYGKIKLIIGLFCSSNYSFNSISKLLKDLIGTSFKNIKKLDVSHGKFIAYLNDGNIKEVSIKDTSKYHYSSCKYCRDYTAEFADISIGSVGAPSDIWNSTIIRTDIGQQVFNDALTSNKIITSNKIEIQKIRNLAKKKKFKIIPINGKIYSTFQFFGISKSEIEVYTTLLSLGESDLIMLSEITKKKPEIIHKILKTLTQRKWILKINDFYRPINPSQVIKEERDYFIENLTNQINKIKSEALEDLKTIFFQNNLINLKDLESIDIFL